MSGVEVKGLHVEGEGDKQVFKLQVARGLLDTWTLPPKITEWSAGGVR